MRFNYTNETVDTELERKGIRIARMDAVRNGHDRIQWECFDCCHKWRTSPTKILKAGTSCPVCSYRKRALPQKVAIEELDDRLANSHPNITRISDPANMRDSTKWNCTKCGHIWYNSPTNLLRTKIGCPVCERTAQVARNRASAHTNDIIDKRTESTDIRRVGEYVNMLTKIRWACVKCGHNWDARPNDIINNSSGCPCCSPVSHSKVAIRWLDSVAAETGLFIQHAENSHEFRVPGTRFKVDGYCSDTNTVYEFYGDIYHGNPLLFLPNESCNPFTAKTAGELYKQTMARECIIRGLGYNLVTKWETSH